MRVEARLAELGLDLPEPMRLPEGIRPLWRQVKVLGTKAEEHSPSRYAMRRPVSAVVTLRSNSFISFQRTAELCKKGLKNVPWKTGNCGANREFRM